jgi:hypothetical protein
MANLKHKWERVGGMKENPGVWDNGNGGLVYVEECAACGLIRKRGVDYTHSRPGNDWSWRYFRRGQNRGLVPVPRQHCARRPIVLAPATAAAVRA